MVSFFNVLGMPLQQCHRGPAAISKLNTSVFAKDDGGNAFMFYLLYNHDTIPLYL